MVPAPGVDTMSTFYSPSNNHLQRMVAAYYPSWKIYKGCKPSDLRIKLLTHVYYAFARCDANGNVHGLDAKADSEYPVDGVNGCFAALRKVRDEQNPNCKLILSVGGGSGSANFPAIAADKAKTIRFCETARAMVDKHNLDGLDGEQRSALNRVPWADIHVAEVDWEHPKDTSQGIAFVHLMKALRKHFPAPRYVLSAALPAGEWCLRNIDLKALLGREKHVLGLIRGGGQQPIMDHINLMTYDFAGSWTDGQSGHQAQLYAPTKPHNAFAKRSIAGAVQYLTTDRGIDPSRIVVGIPAYGRAFVGVGGPGEYFTRCGGEADGTYEYRALPLDGASEHVDHAACAVSCKGGPNSEWVTYDNPQTVTTKTKYAIANGLAGVFFWTGSFDAVDEERSLIVAASRVMNHAADDTR